MVAAGREWAGSRAQVSQSYLDNADNADAMCRYGGTNAKWLQIDGPSGDRKLGALIPPAEHADDGKARHSDQQKPGDDGNPCHRLVKLVGLLGWRGGGRGVRRFGYLTHTSHDAAGPRRPQVGEIR